MGTAISLRDDFDSTALRQLARQSKSANQARRLLALAEIYDGGSRTLAARIGGAAYSTARHREDGRCSMMLSAERLPERSSAVRSRRSMASFAGG